MQILLWNLKAFRIHNFGVLNAMTVKWGITKENISPSIFCSPLITKENAYYISKYGFSPPFEKGGPGNLDQFIKGALAPEFLKRGD